MLTPRVGRPIKFKSAKQLQGLIEKYIKSCFEEEWEDEIERDADGNRIIDPQAKYGKYKYKAVKKIKRISPVTVGGLAVFLGTTRDTLRDYRLGGPESIEDPEERARFSDTIKKAWSFIEFDLEQGMLDGRINPIAGIFNAKNNFGWKDKTDIGFGDGEALANITFQVINAPRPHNTNNLLDTKERGE